MTIGDDPETVMKMYQWHLGGVIQISQNSIEGELEAHGANGTCVNFTFAEE